MTITGLYGLTHSLLLHIFIPLIYTFYKGGVKTCFRWLMEWEAGPNAHMLGPGCHYHYVDEKNVVHSYLKYCEYHIPNTPQTGNTISLTTNQVQNFFTCLQCFSLDWCHLFLLKNQAVTLSIRDVMILEESKNLAFDVKWMKGGKNPSRLLSRGNRSWMCSNFNSHGFIEWCT